MENMYSTVEDGKQPSATGVGNKQVIIFKLGGQEYALMIEQVREVVPTPPVAKVPLMPAYVKGLANVRGLLMTVLDLEERLALAHTPEDKSYMLVIENPECFVGVLVKEVPNTLSISEDEIDYSLGGMVEHQDNRYVRGMIRQEDRMIVLLDTSYLTEKPQLTDTLK